METWIYITWGGWGGCVYSRTENIPLTRHQLTPSAPANMPRETPFAPQVLLYIYTMTKTRDPFNSQSLSSVSQLLPPHKCPEWKPAGWGQRVVCFVLKYTSALQADKTFCHQPTRGMTDITINQRGYYLPHVTEFQY